MSKAGTVFGYHGGFLQRSPLFMSQIGVEEIGKQNSMMMMMMVTEPQPFLVPPLSP